MDVSPHKRGELGNLLKCCTKNLMLSVPYPPTHYTTSPVYCCYFSANPTLKVHVLTCTLCGSEWEWDNFHADWLFVQCIIILPLPPSAHVHTCTCTVESHDYAPPSFVHASIGQKWGGGLIIHGILTLPCDDHYRPSNATWARDLCTFIGCLVDKKRQSNK